MIENVTIYTPDTNPHTGYGRMSLELMYRFDRLGQPVNVIGDDWHAFESTLSPAVQQLLNQPLKPTVGGIALGYPTLYEQYPLLFAGKVIAATMFESTKLPPGWVKILNQCDGIQVPAEWMLKTLLDNGVTRPIRVIPLGISESFNFVQRPYPKVFTFLTIGDRGFRKGWDVACKAFVKAFGNSSQHRLIVKCRPGALDGITIQNPNIQLLEADMSEAELMELYARCDAMIFPSRGEGFGLPPREFARTGGPVIATQWSGLADDLPEWGYPLRYKLVDAWEGDKMHGDKGLGKWADPDLEHLIEQMKWVASEKRHLMWTQGYRDPKSGLLHEPQGELVALKIRRLYSWQTFAEGMLAFWEQTEKHKSLKELRAERKRKKAEAQHGN